MNNILIRSYVNEDRLVELDVDVPALNIYDVLTVNIEKKDMNLSVNNKQVDTDDVFIVKELLQINIKSNIRAELSGIISLSGEVLNNSIYKSTMNMFSPGFNYNSSKSTIGFILFSDYKKFDGELSLVFKYPDKKYNNVSSTVRILPAPKGISLVDPEHEYSTNIITTYIDPFGVVLSEVPFYKTDMYKILVEDKIYALTVLNLSYTISVNFDYSEITKPSWIEVTEIDTTTFTVKLINSTTEDNSTIVVKNDSISLEIPIKPKQLKVFDILIECGHNVVKDENGIYIINMDAFTDNEDEFINIISMNGEQIVVQDITDEQELI